MYIRLIVKILRSSGSVPELPGKEGERNKNGGSVPELPGKEGERNKNDGSVPERPGETYGVGNGERRSGGGRNEEVRNGWAGAETEERRNEEVRNGWAGAETEEWRNEEVRNGWAGAETEERRNEEVRKRREQGTGNGGTGELGGGEARKAGEAEIVPQRCFG